MPLDLEQLPTCSLEEALAQDHLLITPEQRLARRFLVASLHVVCPKLDIPVVEPRIHHLPGWLNDLVDGALLRHERISPPLHLRLIGLLEEHFLWQRVIEADGSQSRDSLLTDPADTAVQASRAHHMAAHWQIGSGVEGDSEWHTFLSWKHQYLHLCRKKGIVDSVCRLQDIAAALHKEELEFDRDRITLCGFVEPTTLERELLSCVCKQGMDVFRLDSPHGDLVETAPRICADVETETRMAASWARRMLSRGARRILVAMPALQSRRLDIARVFQQTLNPEDPWPLESSKHRIWNINCGIVSGGRRDVGTALRLLDLCHPPRDLWTSREISQLIRAPGLGRSEAEREARARLDVRFRRLSRCRWSLADFISMVESWDDISNRLPSLLEQSRSLCRILESTRAVTEPVRFLENILQACAWPGDLPMAPESLHDFAEQLERLNQVHQLVSFRHPGEALEKLRDLGGKAMLHEYQNELSPIQIMKPEDACQQEFDAVWVLGLTDNAWPGEAETIPFLPLSAQESLPFCNRVQAFARAHRILDSIGHPPARGIVSYACSDGEQEYQPSTILSREPAPVVELPEPLPLAAHIIRSSFHHALEWQTDDHGPRLDSKRISQGVSWLACQASCPLVAFTRHRLHAGGLPNFPEDVLDNLARGRLIHDALENFWTSIKGNRELSVMSTTQRDRKLQEAIEYALDGFQQRTGVVLPRNVLHLEQRRMGRLLEDSFRHDLARSPFRIVCLETELEIRAGSLQFIGRVDRIEQLEDGKLLVVDYKTAAATRHSWLQTERLLTPQLPLYALCMQDARGAFILHVNLRESGWVGSIAADACDQRATNSRFRIEDWDSLQQQWRCLVERLAQEIVSGHAGAQVYDEKNIGFQPEKIMLRSHPRHDCQ